MYSLECNKGNSANQLQLDNQAEHISKFLRFIWQPGEVREFRCPKAGKWRTVSGYFDDPALMVKDALHWSGKVQAVYYTINPAKRDLLARCCNRSQGYAEHTTNDGDIERRRLVLIDTDPSRPAGISSTEEEHDLALAKSGEIAAWLAEQGFADGIRADSGNGGHLLYAVDLPNDEPSTDLVQRFLSALAQRFNGDGKVKVDTTVFNASRISKLYGTLTMKGDNTTDRPHRYSQVLSYPAEWKAVPVELLEKVADEYKSADPASKGAKSGDKPLPADKSSQEDNGTDDAAKSEQFVKQFLDKHGVKHTQKGDGRWFARFLLETCPFCGESDKPAVVTVSKAGIIGFKCQHNRCNGENKKSWRDFRHHYEPDWTPDEPSEEDNEDKLLEAIRSACELWHSPDWKSYATMESGQHLPVEGSSFARWATSLALHTTGRGLSKNKLDTLVSTCSAIACEGEKHEVHRRVARLGDVIEIDLGDDTFEAVIITPDGWTIGRPSARFVRSDNAAPLPRPVRGGSLDQLRPFVNLSDEQFPLFIGSILDAYKGHSPYLITAFTGEQGTSKSTLVRMKRKLIDPVHKAELASCPKEERDLAVRAENNYFLAYDNIGKIPSWLSDAFCRVSTSGGFSTRSLYTNSEETILDLCRPLALNGIEDFVVAGDLIDRTVNIRPEVIPEEDRKEETAFWADFHAVEPLVLAVLYDTLSAGLRNRRSVSLPKLPRMADSAKWIAACFPALGWTYDDWNTPYEAANNEAVMGSLEGNSATGAAALLDWFQGKTSWTGTPRELYDLLHAIVPYEKQRYFPASPQSLSSALTRFAPALRMNGIEVKKDRTKTARFISVTRIKVTQGMTQVTQGDATKNACCVTENTVKQGINGRVTQGDAIFTQTELSRKEKEDMESADMEREKGIMPKIASPCVTDAKTPRNTEKSVTEHGSAVPSPSVTVPSPLPQPRIGIRQLSNGLGWYVEDYHRRQKNGEPHIMAFHPKEEDAIKDARKFADCYNGCPAAYKQLLGVDKR